MSIPPLVSVAVLDASVLFPMVLCDTLMRAALEGLYRAYWNPTIFDEIERNLILHGRTTPEGARRRCLRMQRALSEAMVKGYESRIAEMTNDAKDRHVLATAVYVRAQIIVTQNHRHFPAHALTPYSIEAQSADTFLNSLFTTDPDTVTRIITEQSARLQNPPQSVEQVLDNLSLEAPTFVRAFNERMRQR